MPRGRVGGTAILRAVAAAACVFTTSTAVARGAVSAPPIPGHFAFHETDTADMRCSYAIGAEFKPVPQATGYSVQYYDGYYNSDAYSFSDTSADFLAGQYSTPTSFFHAITGGSGPQPCTGDTSRFPRPPLILPTYPTGKNPPLAASRYRASPAGTGSVAIHAASGTFPTTVTPALEVVIKPSVTLTSASLTNLHLTNGAAGGTGLDNDVYGTLRAHQALTFTTQVTGTRPGTVAMSVTLRGRTKHGKKVTIKAASSIGFGGMLQFG